ncbi:hypothetical protein FRC08_007633 [Ceratobasidium sp. 394]|nr:hypothetical protein FRC08_007633 [Ceratobasidium sp. 394]
MSPPRNKNDEDDTTEADPGLVSRSPATTASSSSRPPDPRPRDDAAPATARQQPPRPNPSAEDTGSTQRRFAERSTKEQKTAKVLQIFAESNRYNLGDFLAHILDPTAELEGASLTPVSYWLQGKTRAGTRPAEIVDAIYRHPDGFQRDRRHQLSRPSFSDLTPPTHPPTFTNSHPADVSLLPVSQTGSLSADQTNSRQGLEEIMVRGTLCLVEREAQILADKDIGLMRGAGMTWDDVESLSQANQESAIRLQAPVIWTILSTIVLSRTVASAVDPQIQVQGARPGPRARDTIPAIMIVICMLISLRNPLVNYFQAVMSVFMFACNTHKLLYLVTNRIGLSTSHSTLHGHLGRLGSSASAKLKAFAQRAFESACDPAHQPQQFFLLVFDNVNKFSLA